MISTYDNTRWFSMHHTLPRGARDRDGDQNGNTVIELGARMRLRPRPIPSLIPRRRMKWKKIEDCKETETKIEMESEIVMDMWMAAVLWCW